MLLIAAAGAVLVAASQKIAFFPDEGFHLNAARLINMGKSPYVDFLYNQPPLYAYTNAVWMRIFGETWRSSHLLSAVLATCCLLVIIEYLFRRLNGVQATRAAILTTVFFAVNTQMVTTGMISQAYAVCMFCSLIAFRFAVARRGTPAVTSIGSGFFAAAAAESSLLAAPVLLVLLVWTVWTATPGQRIRRVLQYVAGSLIAFMPLAILMVRGPRQTFFNLVEYQFLYRQTGFKDLGKLSVEQVQSWFGSPQNALLVFLGVYALLTVYGIANSDNRTKSEFTLFACFAGYLFLFLAFVVTPTFSPYFVLVVPMLSLLAGAGASWLANVFQNKTAQVVVVVLLVALYSAPSAPFVLYKKSYAWVRWADIAQDVNRVAPEGLLYSTADQMYFLTKRPLLPGLGAWWAEKMTLEPSLAALVQTVPKAEIDRWLFAGRFAVVVIEENDPRFGPALLRVYPNKKSFDFGIIMLWK